MPIYFKFADFLIPLAISFIVSVFSTKFVIIKLKERGMMAPDVNKPEKPLIPTPGGSSIVMGFIAGLLYILLQFNRLIPISRIIIETTYSVLLSSLLLAFLGLIDDFLSLSQKIRAFLPIFASIPLILSSVGHSTLRIPFMGNIDFGIWYYIIIIPFTLTISSNAFNMLEGLNGLATGMGIIMSTTLAIVGIIEGNIFSNIGTLFSLSLLGSLIGFFLYNKYPSKVFIGNIGTYFIGATIGSIGITGFMLSSLFFLYIPYAVEFFLKARTKFKGVCFGKVDSGYLIWDESPQSLTHIVMKMGKFKEYEIVSILWIVETIFSILAILVVI